MVVVGIFLAVILLIVGLSVLIKSATERREAIDDYVVEIAKRYDFSKPKVFRDGELYRIAYFLPAKQRNLIIAELQGPSRASFMDLVTVQAYELYLMQ